MTVKIENAMIVEAGFGRCGWLTMTDAFVHYPENPAVLRIRISDHKLEQVADLKGFAPTGFWGFWLGLDPEDSPLMLRDAGTQDVYSLDWIPAK
jgi:hypothetical protein